jgi:hypothetical protein
MQQRRRQQQQQQQEDCKGVQPSREPYLGTLELEVVEPVRQLMPTQLN